MGGLYEGLESEKAQLCPPVSGRPAPYPGREGNTPHPFDLFLFLSLAPLLRKPGSETRFLPFWPCLLPMPFTSAHLSSEGSSRGNKAETQKNLSSPRMSQLQSLVNFQLNRN